MSTRPTLRRAVTGLAVLLLAATGCVAAPRNATTHYQSGAASYYNVGGGTVAFPSVRTSNGCAHRTAAPGTVLHLQRGSRSTTCVVNDRGPFISGRIVDLQAHQFRRLGPISAGVLHDVEVRY
ncbi:MAG: septal ring lytic transglycosylase RlpA family protein [Microthrixaceae bacterium]